MTRNSARHAVPQAEARHSGAARSGTAPTGAVPPYDAVIFELDGVLADTAAAQTRADTIDQGSPAGPGVRVFAGTVDLVRRLRAGGVPTGLVAAAGDASAVPASANLQGLFDVIVDGAPATVDASLAASTDPDAAVLVEATRRLAVAPARTAVVAAASVGVRAARRGGFGLVVAINRAGQRPTLEAAGADVVLDDVALLDLGVLRADPWRLAYAGFDPAHEGHREALTTLGNGYFGTRGAAPERTAGGAHYPGTYLAGVYNRLISMVQGRQVEDEHLVNAPNWLLLDVRVAGGRWWSDGGLTAGQERRELDLRRGVLTRQVQLTDPTGRRLQLTQRRLVSMHRPHLAALETTVTPRGWSGDLGVRCGIDASVTNSNVAEYAALADRHLDHITVTQPAPDTLLVQAQTTQSQITIATAARTRIEGASVQPVRRLEPGPHGRHAQLIDIPVRDGHPIVIDKTVAVTTSRDRAISTPALGALDHLARAPHGVAGLLPEHEAAWARLWDRFGIRLHADRDTQLVLNLHLFHILQTIGPHTTELDVGVPARGLHGEGYRGHVFWDELFVLPLFTMHLPAVTRAMLDYRWRRLDAARQAARAVGLAGALFPWQSGSNGREETPAQLFNLRSQRWMPDNSRRQRHVGLAVAYNTWQYYQATGDTAWLADRGAELIIEVTRLFAALAEHDPDADRFHISGVMGPDEYHDGYPDTPGGGLRDNAYTNVLTAWVCQRAVDTLATLAGHDCDDVVARLDIGRDEEALWARMGRRLAVPFHADSVISQFDGYEALTELDWERYRATYGNIGRLDLILEAEGDTTNRYKLAKQADVLMLIYLLGPEELLELLHGLGYPATTDTLERTIDYYLARTANGSTLSRVVHASVLARIDPARAWATFRDALVADLDDTQGGTTREGIHLGAMAGTVDIIARAFAGMHARHGTLTFAPRLPDALHRVEFEVQHRCQRITVTVEHDRLRLAANPCCRAAAPVPVGVAGTRITVGGGQVQEIDLRAR